MTDLERTTLFFDSLHIPYTLKLWGEEGNQVNVLTVSAKASDKVLGYTGFFTDFEFYLDGKFKSMGIWE